MTPPDLVIWGIFFGIPLAVGLFLGRITGYGKSGDPIFLLTWAVMAIFLMFMFILQGHFDISTYINKLAEGKEGIIIALGWIMGGVLAIINAAIFNTRAAAQIEILKEQVKSNQLTEKGHIQDRFKAATEHLGSEKSIVRMASFNEFYYFARDNENLRKDVFEILCDHLRNTARDGEICGPTQEVQKLLNILFKPNDKNEYIFENFSANLSSVCLDFADLENARMKGAKFGKILGANFRNAILEESDFSGATLSNVDFVNTNLTNANLSHISILSGNGIMNNFAGAKFHCANFSYAKIQEVNFAGVEFQGAIFYDAKFHGADFSYAKMQGADLSEAKLHGVNLSNAIFHGADLSGADLGNARLENTEFQGAILSANFGIIVNMGDENDMDSNEALILSKSVFFEEIPEKEANATKNILRKCKNDFSKVGLYTNAVKTNKGKNKTFGLFYDNPEHKELIATIEIYSSKPDE